MEAKVVQVNGGRIRKVTLTEPDDEAERSWTDPRKNDEESVIEKSTDEVFSILENIVTDWKVKLEIVVAEGMKQITKVHQEKKTMMKYLPGDGIPASSAGLLKAKESILNEWKGDVTDIVQATHNKLSNLGYNQAAEATLMVDGFFHTKLAKKNSKDKNFKTGRVLDMKNLMSELEILYQQYNVQKPYSLLLKEWNDNNVKMRESKAKMLKNKNMKKVRKGKKSMKGLKDRKEVRGEKKVMLREFEDKGGKHFIVVSKNVQSLSAVKDAEDIFSDWKTNFAQIKRPRSLKPRVRKISHRQERKEMIKEAQKEGEIVFGPLTYSQMLRKNLKIVTDQPSVEDIFENWRSITEEDEDVVMTNQLLPASKTFEDVDFFKVWKHNLHVEADRTEDIEILNTSIWNSSIANFECGQPTVPCIPKKEKSKKHLVTKQEKNTTNATNIENSTEESITLKPIKSNMQVVPFIERKIPMPLPAILSKKTIPLPDLFTNKGGNQQYIDEAVIVKGKVDKDVKAQNEGFTKKSAIKVVKTLDSSKKEVEIAKPTTKRVTVPESKNRGGKNIVKKQTWTSLLVPTEEPSGRGDRKQPEDVFLSWQHIFADSDISSLEASETQPENIFFDWLFNLEQIIPAMKPNISKEKEMKPSSDEILPKPSKKEARKQKNVEDINETITDIKQNRRQDFVRNTSIKDKKRSEATRRSTGKKIK